MNDVTAQATRLRMHEIGPHGTGRAECAPDVLSLVVREGMATIVAGMVIGLCPGCAKEDDGFAPLRDGASR